MSFEENIQKWVATDNLIKSHNQKLKELRELRNNLNANIFLCFVPTPFVYNDTN